MALCLPRAALEALLFEDAPYGDLTTEALDLNGPGVMRFEARAEMVAALVEEAACLLELAGATVEIAAASGAVLAPGAQILAARGPAASLLRGWKVAQTLIEIWSGVATGAREIVEAAPGAVVACTRKNSSGAKAFAVAAVRAGGATIHRLGLSETILVFPEHRAFLEGETLAETAARLRRAAPEKMLAIEVKNSRRWDRRRPCRLRRDPGGKIRARGNRPFRRSSARLAEAAAPRRRRRDHRRQRRRFLAGRSRNPRDLFTLFRSATRCSGCA